MKYWPIIIVFIGVAVWMVMSARTPTGDEGLHSIFTAEQYNQTLAKVRDLTQQPILDFDSGKPITTGQAKELREGKELIRKMIAFEPTNFGPYVMMAKTLRALDEMEESVRNYKQALELMPAAPTDEETRWTKAEVLHDLASYYYEEQDDKRAEEYALQAVELINTNPKYLVMLAAIDAQLGKLTEARALVDTALQLDPQNIDARRLDDELKNANK